MSDIAAARKTVEALIRDVPDFPKPGILFKDLNEARNTLDVN